MAVLLAMYVKEKKGWESLGNSVRARVIAILLLIPRMCKTLAKSY